jgi:hypothetical protein
MTDDPRETARQIADGLRQYVEWHGAIHEEACPCDDTCDCSGKRSRA